MKAVGLTISLLILSFGAYSQTQETKQIDELGNRNCEDYLFRMDGAINIANNNPNAKIVVFVYEGKVRKYRKIKDGSYKSELASPEFGLAGAKIRSMKKFLNRRGFGEAKGRFVILRGGFREEFTAELWLVPNGVSIPKPTPTLEKMKYRSGKPSGFCMDADGM